MLLLHEAVCILSLIHILFLAADGELHPVPAVHLKGHVIGGAAAGVAHVGPVVAAVVKGGHLSAAAHQLGLHQMCIRDRAGRAWPGHR